MGIWAARVLWSAGSESLNQKVQRVSVSLNAAIHEVKIHHHESVEAEKHTLYNFGIKLCSQKV